MTGAYSHPDSNFYIPRIKGECEKAIIEANYENEYGEVNRGKQCVWNFSQFTTINSLEYWKTLFKQILDTLR